MYIHIYIFIHMYIYSEVHDIEGHIMEGKAPTEIIGMHKCIYI
jgi:hypothetical protein